MVKPLNTLVGVVFWTDESIFRKVQLFLKERGFVNSNSWDPKDEGEFWWDDTLVYEENSVGLYRCSFHRKHQEGPCLEFKYWERRLRGMGILKGRQLARDPLRDIVLEVYEMLKPVKITNYVCEEFALE